MLVWTISTLFGAVGVFRVPLTFPGLPTHRHEVTLCCSYCWLQDRSASDRRLSIIGRAELFVKQTGANYFEASASGCFGW